MLLNISRFLGFRQTATATSMITNVLWPWAFVSQGRKRPDWQRNPTPNRQIAALHWDTAYVTFKGERCVCNSVCVHHVPGNNLCACLSMYREQRNPGNHRQTYGPHVQQIQRDSLELGACGRACGYVFFRCYQDVIALWQKMIPRVTFVDRFTCVCCPIVYVPSYTCAHIYTVRSAKLCQVLTGCKALWLVWESGTVTEWQPKSPVCGDGSGIPADFWCRALHCLCS